ncbi:hypothetical protein GDO81_013610 [Engystomops pustulosus]|uniref:Uncharacterized protein n=1 Tax=Engystomops pustulosus TaxID=76066 RepID=A0AAV7B0U0_ENGPU|nr:hypothetical protein GDO81_013610 [Engystomops pustulosus]
MRSISADVAINYFPDEENKYTMRITLVLYMVLYYFLKIKKIIIVYCIKVKQKSVTLQICSQYGSAFHYTWRLYFMTACSWIMGPRLL